MELSKSILSEDVKRWKDALFDDLRAKDFSANTLEMYDRILNSFIEYVKKYDGETSMNTIRPMVLNGFLGYMDEKGGKKSVATKEVYVKAVKKLLSFVSENNDEFFSYDNIVKTFKVRGDKKTHEKIKFLTKEERTVFKEGINVLADSYMDKNEILPLQTVLLAKILMFAGLRISEALGLKTSDVIDGEKFYLLSFIGKGGEQQTAPILKKIIEVELDYLKNKSKELLDYDSPKPMPLFLKKSGKVLDRFEAYKKLTKLLRDMGINKQGCHVFRHTLAMDMVDNNINIVHIKGVLRHESINTTMKYAEATKESSKEAVEKIAETVKDF